MRHTTLQPNCVKSSKQLILNKFHSMHAQRERERVRELFNQSTRAHQEKCLFKFELGFEKGSSHPTLQSGLTQFTTPLRHASITNRQMTSPRRGKPHESDLFVWSDIKGDHAAKPLSLSLYKLSGMHPSWMYCNTRSMRGVGRASSYPSSLFQKPI